MNRIKLEVEIHSAVLAVDSEVFLASKDSKTNSDREVLAEIRALATFLKSLRSFLEVLNKDHVAHAEAWASHRERTSY
jgi:hypothetical protein